MAKRGNQNPYIEEKNRQHNGQKKKDKQRLTKHTYNSKDRVA